MIPPQNPTVTALVNLGFNTGWVVTGLEITFWDNPEPQPTPKELAAALK